MVEMTLSAGLSLETCFPVSQWLHIYSLARASAQGLKGSGSTILVTLVRRLVYDCAVLEAAKIEHSHTSVRSAAYKYVNALGTEAHVEHLLVVSNELCLRGKGGNIPDCTGSVNTGSDNQAWRYYVPVQRRDWSRVFRRF